MRSSGPRANIPDGDYATLRAFVRFALIPYKYCMKEVVASFAINRKLVYSKGYCDLGNCEFYNIHI